MAKLFVFRHGETTDNRDRVFSGVRPVDLTEKGEEEAVKMGEELKDKNATIAYHSGQPRSQHTLELVLGDNHPNVKIIEDVRLRERDYGDLTGQSKDEVEKMYKDDYPLWHRSYNNPPPNGESIKDVEDRVLEFLNEVMPNWKPDDVIFISAHGNSLRPIRRRFEGLSIEEMCSFEHTPGKIYSYEI